MISSSNLISSYFIRDTGRASSQPSGNLSNAFPDGIPVGNLILLMRREFPMGSHNPLFGYRFLSCSDPKLNLGSADQSRSPERRLHPFRIDSGSSCVRPTKPLSASSEIALEWNADRHGSII